MGTSGRATAAFEEYLLSVDQMGLEKTTQALINERKKYVLLNNSDAKAVLAMVCRTFKIPEKEVLNGVGRKNERRDAIAFCGYYLHYILGHDMELVQHMLNKSQWLLYKYSKRIKLLNPAHAADKKYVGWKTKFDTELRNHGIIKA